MSPSIRRGQQLPLCCLVDMVDQLPDLPRERIFVKVSFVALLIEDEEQILVLAFFLNFSQVYLEGLNQTKRVIL